MGGKPKDPLYWRKWRASHPEYRAREKIRKKRYRAFHPKKEIDQEPIPDLHTGHPVFDQAREIVGPLLAHQGRVLKFPSEVLQEDLISEAVLAIVAGLDVGEHVRIFRQKELAWQKRTCQLALDDGKGRLDDFDHRCQ